jgi:hypothetical protein
MSNFSEISWKENFKILNEIKIISNVEDLYDDDVIYKVMTMPLA